MKYSILVNVFLSEQQLKMAIFKDNFLRNIGKLSITCFKGLKKYHFQISKQDVE